MVETSRTLRPLRESDLDQLLSWRNHPQISQYMYHQQPISLSEHQQWFDRVAKDPSQHCFIFEDNQVACGYVRISCYAWDNMAEWGFYVAPDAIKGTGMRLGKAAIDYCFHQLQLDKLNAEVIDYNTVSVNYHKRLGFVAEGYRKHYYRRNNVLHDILFFGLQRHQPIGEE